MEKVEFYSVQKKTMAYAGHVVRYHLMEHPNILCNVNEGGLAIGDEVRVMTKETPVHRILFCGEERFIAITDELRDILRPLFNNEYKQLVRELKAARDEAHENLMQWDYHFHRIKKFEAMPWYKRIYYAMIGVI